MGNEKKEGREEGKKDDGTITVVLKVDMHCDGCAEKVKKSVKGFEGNLLFNSLDPSRSALFVWICPTVECLQLYRGGTGEGGHRWWEADGGGEGGSVEAPRSGGRQDPQEGRPRFPHQYPKKGRQRERRLQKGRRRKGLRREKIQGGVSTVVLKTHLHCDGCVKRITKKIRKLKGVQQVTADAQKDLVTVTGTMDAKALPEVLKQKLKQAVEVAPPKKQKGGDKKEKGGEKETGAGGGKDDSGKAEANRTVYQTGYPYRIEMVPAPQLFSDDNPNGCSVM